MVAYALEMEPALVPHAPELLGDLTELGGDAALIVDVLRELDLPRAARVVDLGSGKGAVSVAIAENLGLRVLGLELFAPFVEASLALARKRAVADLCEFRQGNILTFVAQGGSFDVAVLAALGDVIGRLDDTIRVVRQYVRPGGWLVVADDFIEAGASADFPRFENYAGHAETVRRLTACGDAVIRELRIPTARQRKKARRESRLIRARAEQIAAVHPELEDELLGFAASQEAEYRFIEENMVEALWVLKRA